MRLVFLGLIAACHAPTPISPSDAGLPDAGVPGSDLARAVALARVCSSARPDKPAIAPGASIRPKSPGVWLISVALRPDGELITHTIEPARDLCDGQSVRLTGPAPTPVDGDALLGHARACATEPATAATGVWGEPLLLDAPLFSYDPTYGWNAVAVRYDETSQKGTPSGVELTVAADGSLCARAPMD
jgi:hypothetical protein